jgi:hypothetical protein
MVTSPQRSDDSLLGPRDAASIDQGAQLAPWQTSDQCSRKLHFLSFGGADVFWQKHSVKAVTAQ